MNQEKYKILKENAQTWDWQGLYIYAFENEEDEWVANQIKALYFRELRNDRKKYN